MADAPPISAALNPQEQRAREFLAQGKFRKARDEFKVLCKTDRARYLPWLIEANCGLARALAARGMKPDAMQVLAYLKTLGPSLLVQALEIELGADVGQTPGGLAGLLSLMGDPNLPAATRQRLADQAVLRFEIPEATPHPGVGELAAIIKALQAISERQYQLALDLVRPLPHVSPFSHWKTLVKGMAAFHGGEWEKAVRAFDTLPADSAPGKAAQPYRLLAATTDPISQTAVPSEKTLEMAGRLAGAPPGCGGILSRAEQAWRNGRPDEMYRTLRSIPAFPKSGADFIGTLSDFALGCLRLLNLDQRDRYFCDLEDIVRGGISKSETESALLTKAAVLILGNEWDDHMLIAEWSKFVELCDRVHGANPKRSSLAYGWLGETLSKPFADSYAGDDHPPMSSAAEARRALETSLRFDGDNLAASLLLCRVYAELKLNSERNRLLDTMTVRFPGEKAVLLLAGQSCLERKACAKALNYFEQALSLDRLDPSIPDLMAEAQATLSLQHFQKGKLDRAREAMDLALTFALDHPAGAKRARWRLQTQQALLEMFFGEAERGAAQLKAVREKNPYAAAILFFAGIASHEMNDKKADPRPFFREFNALSGNQIQARDALLLTEIWTQHKPQVRRNEFRQLQASLSTALRKIAKASYSREEAVKLIEFLLVEEGDAVSRLDSTALLFVQAWLREHPDDLLFRLYLVRLRAEPDPEAALNEIIAEATRRKDDRTAQMARQQLEAFRRPPPSPVPDTEFNDDFEDDSDETDPLGADRVEDFAKTLFPKMSPIERVPMTLFLKMLATAPPAMLEEMKRTRPRDMSAKDFDLLVNALREMPALPAPNQAPPKAPLIPPKPNRAKPRPSFRPPDPNQPDFFRS